ncbi:MAG: tRNA (adenosine(37)-N6)-dimethylallyltransferase MiaA [Paracoccaceae bacterium]|nr:tRNA (adenosine(37)-N6)-dimethylallyltransferase MiaA [Paracoccaceae bacterium]MDG1736860.1 tRNA (adenosine(37)-N6)-dimethylallyltransferase MiaA [Paracoccaceae bacterium]MDG2259168.1 tRNA (adenosine(37)-N6)-dimethylallyltransferase MiaA [Paracoccaceae bacterium]
MPDIGDGPVLIAGPTASGKSSLAMEIASQFGGQIVNADAIQVFDEWRVLTARPSKDDEAAFPHKLYGHVPLDGEYSVGHWLRDVEPLLKTGPRPIIVGGTGLYFTALTQGLAQIPEIPQWVRDEGNTIRDRQGHEAMLVDLDTVTVSRIDIQNPMRVQRAWEVWKATGKQISVWQDETPPALLDLDTANAFVMDAPKDWLNERIAQRFDHMLETGALEEAEEILPRWNPANLSSKAIGAPELIAFLRGETSLDQAKERATIATRQYAKRQRTWFKSRMSEWRHINPSST